MCNRFLSLIREIVTYCHSDEKIFRFLKCLFAQTFVMNCKLVIFIFVIGALLAVSNAAYCGIMEVCDGNYSLANNSTTGIDCSVTKVGTLVTYWMTTADDYNGLYTTEYAIGEETYEFSCNLKQCGNASLKPGFCTVYFTYYPSDDCGSYGNCYPSSTL